MKLLRNIESVVFFEYCDGGKGVIAERLSGGVKISLIALVFTCSFGEFGSVGVLYPECNEARGRHLTRLSDLLRNIISVDEIDKRF